MSSPLFGVSPTDPLTFAGVALLLVTVALLACYLRQRRAMKVDLAASLRHEYRLRIATRRRECGEQRFRPRPLIETRSLPLAVLTQIEPHGTTSD